MSNLLKIIAGILVFFVVGLLLMASLQPDHYRVQRSISINASAAQVFMQINDLKKWRAWSPWVARDPHMTVTFEGDTTAVGGSSSWVSQTEGEGKQTISEVTPNQSFKVNLEFYQPFQGKAKADFVLESVSESVTKLVWGMDGNNATFMDKLFYSLMNFDKMIGTDYEKGLSSIKALAEESVVQ